MDITQLKIFCTVAEQGTVTAAAEYLHRVPSNISTRIKQLETELDTVLFIRDKLKFQLSASGHILYDYACKILAMVDEARDATRGSEPRGRFRLGSLESTAAVRLPPILASYHQRYPQVELDFATGSSDKILHELLEGSLAAAFVDGPLQYDVLTGIPVWQEEMVIVAAANHAPITCARDVAGAPIYAFRNICSYRRLFEVWFRAENVSPGKVFEIESYHAMFACVSAGAGIALAPRSMLDYLPGPKNVSSWSLNGKFQYAQTWLAWRKENHSACLEAMKNLVQASHLAAA